MACTNAVNKAGKLPSVRMTAFQTALKTSCRHLGNGAHDVAKAIGAIGKNNAKLARSYLVKSNTEFKLGSNFLGTAYKQIVADRRQEHLQGLIGMSAERTRRRSCCRPRPSRRRRA